MALYLSFVADEKEKLAERLNKLEELGETLEETCEDILSDLRMQAREAINEAISEAFEEAGIEEDYFNEKSTEAEDEMFTYCERNF